MKKRTAINIMGVTLVEMLLVLVIVSSIIFMTIGYNQQQVLTNRINRTAAQMQQILNAGLSYYIAGGGKWPVTIDQLTKFLPTNGVVYPSPWNSNYSVLQTNSNLYVFVYINVVPANYIAQALIGMLPLSGIATSNSVVPTAGAITACPDDGVTPCYVYSSVNPPGQNLSNAGSVNYMGLYHSGACVPVPPCPAQTSGGPTLAPEIMVIPVSVNGYNDAPSGAPCSATDLSGCTINSYPLSGFTAYATSYTAATAGGGPQTCDGSSSSAICDDNFTNTPITNGNNYWRVCLNVTSEKGQVVPNTNPWGQLVGVILAITRCVPPNENPGSGFSVWSN